MKKVGIITYHHYFNYGSALQAFALQRAIGSIDGYEAEIIDFRAQEENKRNKLQMFLLRLRRFPTYLVEWKRIRILQKKGYILKLKEPAFNSFFNNQFITNGQVFLSYKELKNAKLNYSILVTGSDQTWSPQIGFRSPMFLEFGNPDALRISYAPSIGVSKLSKKEKDYLNYHLRPFEYISCRESLGTKLLSECVQGKKIVNVLDPTFLLNSKDWNRIAIKPGIKGDYILCYFIGHKEYYRKIAKQLSEDLHLPLYFIPVSWQELANYNELLSETGPREFLGLIRDARLVLTDSFHGTAFSINYRKSFYSFTKIEGGKNASDNSRLYDILSKFHLENRLYDQPVKIEFTDIDYTEINQYIDFERAFSFSFLKQALDDNRICSHDSCTGCMACESVCKQNAVLIEKDTMGFFYPRKDIVKCIGCGLCDNRCPNNTKPVFYEPIEAFIATAKTELERNTSTSGGLASVISKAIIKEGGIVYGCTSCDSSNIRHIRIDSEESLYLLKGSKYVQSNMYGVMPLVKNDLDKGKKVLFIGTPCQVAGLKAFLHKPYNSLFTVDFVCHGVPSQQILNDIIIKDYPEYTKKQLKLDFRFKDNLGNSYYGIKLTDNNGNCVYQETYPDSRYIAGFLGGFFYRASCYQCHYATVKRVSDITLGDYWDREKKYKEIGENSLSMMLINTPEGKKIINVIIEDVNIINVPISVLELNNAQLRHPYANNPNQKKYVSEYINNGYSKEAVRILDKEVTRLHHSRRRLQMICFLKNLFRLK